MRNLGPSLASHFQSEVTTIATCWKISRRDRVVLGFTDHDRNLLIDSIQYDSIAGFTPSSVAMGSDMSVDNLDLSGSLFPSQITDTDLLAGIYDFAEVEIFLVNYLDVNAGKVIQKRGVLGEVTLSKNMFHAEIRGLTQFLSQTMCEEYMPHCRANLGDSRCRFNLKQKGFSVTAIVSTSLTRQSFIARKLTASDDWFTGGYVTWRSGKNKTLRMEVKEFSDSVVTLALPMPFDIKTGDRFRIVAGCDKSSKTCIEKFKNIINFRGEPDLPGMDKLMSTAATRKR